MDDIKTKGYEENKGEVHPLVGHVVPLPLLFGIGGTLMLLTVVTVAVTYIDLGKYNLLLALFIAGFKAFLVSLYFMHLRWDRPFNGFVFLVAIAFVMLFVGFALMDSMAYQHQIIEFLDSTGG